MAEKGTVFQTGGGGSNFEQYIQASFLVTMLVKGNAPTIPSNEVTELVLQSSNRKWETDDLLVTAKSQLQQHTILIQAKHNITFSADNTVFKEVIAAFWKDFNNPLFNKTHDRLIIAKSRLNNIERNHIKTLLNYAKTHNSEADFISEVIRIKAKKEKMDMLREVLQVANEKSPVSDLDLWQFCKVFDILGYDFLDEGSVDETYFLNLIKLARNPAAVVSEKDIWNEVIALIAKSNPSGASFKSDSPQLAELSRHFDPAKMQRAYTAVNKLKQDSEAVLIPLKPTIGSDLHTLHINRPSLLESIDAALFSHLLTIIIGKPGVGKSVAVKQCLASKQSAPASFVFRADQFNQPHLSNVMSALGIQDSLADIFSCLALQPDKIIFIDSLEKLLENADPDSAFKQLLAFALINNIKIICTSRTYAVELLIQKFGINTEILKVIEVPLLTDEELNMAVSHFPALAAAVKNTNIRSLLSSPKYLDFTVKAIGLNSDDFSSSTLADFKDKLWTSLVCNAAYRVNGLPAKREKSFMEIAVNRAKEMVLFAKPVNGDMEAIDMLESDDIIFQDVNKRKYAPSHDILEDWALVRFAANCFDDNLDFNSFFRQLGNEPAIRRAFRLWVEDQIAEGMDKMIPLIKACLSDLTIESYWSDELLVAIFKSDNCAPFFSQFETVLLENNAALLNRCMHIIKTTCKENNYELNEQPVLMPVGSGWEQMLLFLHKHLSSLNKIRSAIMEFLYDWDYRLIFAYPKDKPELEAAKQIILFYIGQAEKKSVFWDDRSNATNKRLLITMLFNLALISKEEITALVQRSLSKKERHSSFHSDKIHDIVLKKICYGPAKHQLAYALPDLILEALIKQWKYVPPKPRNTEEKTMFKSFRSPLSKEHSWGINSTFGFNPSGIFKTPVYSISKFHPVKAINFITLFINYSVSHYVKADSDHKHEISEIEITLSDGTKVKEWAAWEFWVAYRGISVTDYLLESLLMTLEKILLDMAADRSPASKDMLGFAFDLVLRNSNNVMTTGVLASVTMAYPEAVGGSFLPLLSLKELYHWDYQRVRREHGTFAMYDEEIQWAQKVRYDSNQLPHRTRNHEGFAGFLIEYQLTIKTFNAPLFDILDKLWSELQDDDIIWKKKLHEIDSRKWVMSKFEQESGQLHIQPAYDEEVAAFIDTGKPELDAANLAATHSQSLVKALDGSEPIDYEKWIEYYKYFSTLEKFNTSFDKPVTFAVIGIRDFSTQLTEKQKKWCVHHLAVTIGYILGGLRNYDFSQPPLYNYIEQDTALHSLHLLLSNVTDSDDIKELTFLSGVVLSSPFPEHDREKLNKYFRELFAPAFPEIFKKLWTILVQLAIFKKKNPYYYDDPDRKRFERSTNKEFKFIENLCKGTNIVKIDSSKISFESAEAYILLNALHIIPTKFDHDDYKKYFLRFLELLFIDLPLEQDSGFGPRGGGKQIHPQGVYAIQKYTAEILVQSDALFAKQLIALLVPFTKITSDRHYRQNDSIHFVLGILDQVVYQVDDFVRSSIEIEKQTLHIERFWMLWDYLASIVKINESPYFSRVLLLNTDYAWSMEFRDSAILKGQSERYRLLMEFIGPSAIQSAVKIFSTIGSTVFLPNGVSWLASLLKKDIGQLKELSVKHLNQLIKLLYVDHIATIKKNQQLITDFLWLLDKLIEKGNSTAYLYRENVIVYKKYS